MRPAEVASDGEGQRQRRQVATRLDRVDRSGARRAAPRRAGPGSGPGSRAAGASRSSCCKGSLTPAGCQGPLSPSSSDRTARPLSRAANSGSRPLLSWRRRSAMFVPLVRPRVPRSRRDVLRRQDRRHRRRVAVHLPRLRDADPPPGERARRAGRRARRSRLVHHLQHAPPARGVLRGDRGGRRPQPGQHPPRAARDRLHPRPRRVEGRLLPPRLRAAGRGDPPAAGDAADARRPRRRARRAGRPRVRGAARRRARPIRSTPRSTRTAWPSSSTRAARPGCPRAWR